MYESYARLVTQAFLDRNLLKQSVYVEAVSAIIDGLDQGKIRIAEKRGETYHVHVPYKEAILLYFAIRQVEELGSGDLIFADKIPTKKKHLDGKVRVVPPGVARYGSYLAPGVILMPGYVNIGAYVDEGTMVDTFATVGSAAQIGKRVHLAGGVGIGGVLEPKGAMPVVVEDDVFIGSRCVVTEGVLVKQGAVLGAGVVLTASTAIVDVTGSTPLVSKGVIPARSVVIPGTMPKVFPAGQFQVPCALIIGQRKASTDEKTSLNDALRDYQVAI